MNKSKRPLVQSILVLSLTLFFYQLIVGGLEYLTTEKYLIYKYISKEIKTIIFLIILVVLNLGIKLMRKLTFAKWTNYISVAIILFSLIGGQIYVNFYRDLQQYPKIFSKKPDWSIQGTYITVDGRNFGEPHKPGAVFLGDRELTIKNGLIIK
jgi:hypothetical protein